MCGTPIISNHSPTSYRSLVFYFLGNPKITSFKTSFFPTKLDMFGKNAEPGFINKILLIIWWVIPKIVSQP